MGKLLYICPGHCFQSKSLGDFLVTWYNRPCLKPVKGRVTVSHAWATLGIEMALPTIMHQWNMESVKCIIIHSMAMNNQHLHVTTNIAPRSSLEETPIFNGMPNVFAGISAIHRR